VYETLFGTHDLKGTVENLRRRLEDDIKMVLRELGGRGGECALDLSGPR
jgi:hypothetical protein